MKPIVSHKPLTQVERADINEVFRRDVPDFAHDVRYAIERLLESEAFWREAVNNRSPYILGDCHYCQMAAPPHKPDCPWLLAQESK